MKIQLRISLTALVLLIGLMLAACDSGSSNPTPTANNTANTPSANTNGASSNPSVELLKQAGSNMKAAKSYYVELTGKNMGSPVTMTAQIDLNAKNTLMSMSMEGQTVTTVQVGNDMFMSTDGGKTFSRTEEGLQGLDTYIRIWEGFNPDTVTKNAVNIKEGNPASATLDGVATRHIVSSDAAATSTIDYWITTAAQPLVKQMKVNSSSTGVDLTMKWSRFNENFDIKAPQQLPQK